MVSLSSLIDTISPKPLLLGDPNCPYESIFSFKQWLQASISLDGLEFL